MLTLLNGVAFGFDFSSAALLLADLLKTKREAEMIDAVQTHIDNLAVMVRKTEKMKPAPDLKIEGGMDYDEVVKIMREASKDAVADSTEALLKKKDELKKSNRIPLALFALIALLVGILLHAWDARVSSGG